MLRAAHPIGVPADGRGVLAVWTPAAATSMAFLDCVAFVFSVLLLCLWYALGFLLFRHV